MSAMNPGDLCKLVKDVTTYVLEPGSSGWANGHLFHDDIVIYVGDDGIFYRLLTSTGVRLISKYRDRVPRMFELL